MITQTLQLNLVPKGISPRLYVTQYDYDSRELTFEIYNGSNRFTLTSGTTAKIQGTKPDRHGFSYNAEVDTTNNVITADITQQMTAVDGDVVVEIVLIKNNKRIGTLNFVMVVQPAGLNDDTDISDTDIPDIIAEATEQMLTAEAYAKGTRNGTAVTSGQTGYHDNSKYYKEQAATQASNASTSATNANTNALKAEGYAVGKQNGTTQTSGTYYHNNAQYYKEQAAGSATTASTKAGEASTSANTASQKASAASTSAQTASDKALVAEGYAKGTQNGTPVGSTSPYYHNNAEYFKNLANPTVAANVSFNNSGTDMSSTNVQDGIVENRTSIQNLSNYVNNDIYYDGVKNLLPLVISKIKVINTVGTWTQSNGKDVYTIRGVVYTITSDANGFITNIKANGTAESGSPYADLYITQRNTNDAFAMYELIKNNTLTVATHAGEHVHFILDGQDDSTWKTVQAFSGKADVTLDISTSNNVQICIRIPATQSVTNENITPIMAQKSLMDIDDSFSPYALTNRQLTRDKVGMDLLSEVGAVNYLPKASSADKSNIHFIVDSNGVVSITTGTGGNAPASGSYGVYVNVTLKPGTYKLTSVSPNSGCYAGIAALGAYDYGDGVIFTVGSETTYEVTAARINDGVTANGIKCYPMISPVEYKGPYVPYAKTNRELTEELTVFDKDTTSISGVTIEKVGHTVTLLIRKTMDVPADAMTSLGTIPSRFRPDGNVDVLVIEENSNPKYGLLCATSSGNLEINGWTISGTSLQIRGTMTYVVK